MARSSGSGSFNQTTLGWLIAIAVILLVLSFVLDTFSGDFFGVQSAGNDTYSRSAVGHRAFKSLLVELGHRVIVSRSESATLRSEASLIVAEPMFHGDDDERRFVNLIDQAHSVLLVLPKWTAIPSPAKPEFALTVDRTWQRTRGLELMEEATDDWSVIDLPESTACAWRSTDEIRFEPTIEKTQLLKSNDALRPIVWCSEGVLFGELNVRGGAVVYVLSDPDVIANHGLGEGDNAYFAVEIVEKFLQYPDTALVFDETCHGHLGGDTAFRKAFRFPLVLATTQFLIIIVLLLWSGMGRFGKARHVPEHLEAGKELLISNSASLFHFSGHSGQALHRFFTSTLQEVLDRFHAPASLERSQHVEWLQKLTDSRQVDVDLYEIQASVMSLKRKKRGTTEAIPRVARKIQQWKRKILDVSGTNPRRQ